MNKPRQSNSTRRARRRQANVAKDRSADPLTAGWMLAVVTAFLCEAAAAGFAWLARAWPGSAAIVLLPGLLLFAALVVGLIGLALLPIALRVGCEPPPPAIIAFAVAVGLAPLVVLAVRAWQLRAP